MLIEQCAYSNRWRKVHPAAKGLFALSGMTAAFAANTPLASVAVAVTIASITISGAVVPVRSFITVAAPPLLFLCLSVATLPLSLNWDPASTALAIQIDPDGAQRAAFAGTRSFATLTALLFFILTTPMSDTIALLRRLKMPEVVLDMMVLCYRMLFVFSGALQDMTTAQNARLGYATPRRAFHSLGGLTANLTLQIWRRSLALHHSALARNGEGPLRFLEPQYPPAAQACIIAALAGGGLIAMALMVQ